MSSLMSASKEFSSKSSQYSQAPLLSSLSQPRTPKLFANESCEEVTSAQRKQQVEPASSSDDCSKQEDEFDARIQTQQGKFDYAAQQAYELIPKKNPDHDSGKLTDLRMLAKYTVEELENDNDLPTVASVPLQLPKRTTSEVGPLGRSFESQNRLPLQSKQKARRKGV